MPERMRTCAWFLLEIGFVRFIPCLPAPLGNPCAEPVRRRCMPEVRLFQTGNTTEKASECEVRHNGTAGRYAAHVIGLVSRCRSAKPAMPNARIAVGTSWGAELSTPSEASTLTAATAAQGVHPKSSLSPVPGRGRYIATVVAQATATMRTMTVQPGEVTRAQPPEATTDSTNSTGARTATAPSLRKGQAACASANLRWTIGSTGIMRTMTVQPGEVTRAQPPEATTDSTNSTG